MSDFGKKLGAAVETFLATEVLGKPSRQTHWIVNRDTGWGCDGCDWTGKLDDYWKTHGRPENDNLPF